MCMRQSAIWAAARRRLAALAGDRDGISAVEFALIVPVMLVMYVGAVEFSHALTIDRRVTTVASAAADLVAQAEEEVTCDEVGDVFEAASSILTPYSTGTLSIVLTSVVADMDDAEETTVDWSRALNGVAHAPGSDFELPAGLTQEGTSVIVAEVAYVYNPLVGEHFTGGITMTETFYLRPRRAFKVELVGC